MHNHISDKLTEPAVNIILDIPVYTDAVKYSVSFTSALLM